MDPSHLSPQALGRLRGELEQRAGPDRRQLSERIERAREHGDIRENADYDAAKNDQGLNEARIRHIEQILAHAVVVESGAGAGVVAAGTVVEIMIEGDDEASVYLVGSIEERHESYDVLSTASPLGRALLGKAPGESVVYEAPRRTLEVEIVSVRSLE